MGQALQLCAMIPQCKFVAAELFYLEQHVAEQALADQVKIVVAHHNIPVAQQIKLAAAQRAAQQVMYAAMDNVMTAMQLVVKRWFAKRDKHVAAGNA